MLFYNNALTTEGLKTLPVKDSQVVFDCHWAEPRLVMHVSEASIILDPTAAPEHAESWLVKGAIHVEPWHMTPHQIYLFLARLRSNYWLLGDGASKWIENYQAEMKKEKP